MVFEINGSSPQNEGALPAAPNKYVNHRASWNQHFLPQVHLSNGRLVYYVV